MGWLPLGLGASVLTILASGALAQSPPRVFLRGGPKTHGEGQHDHPRFVEEWKTLLAERGAVVEGALRFPTAEELARTDVLVLYAAEGASIHGEERARLEEWMERGGGLVVIHDAVCGDDPQWFQSLAGGAWEHGHSKWLEGPIGLCFADREHPITKGVANFDLDDEIYFDLHVDPRAHVLAHAFHTPFDVTPQMWTFERGAGRALVSIQGHRHASFSHGAWRTLLLRGIAWAAQRDADLLTTPAEREALAYPEGGPLRPDAAASALRVHEDFTIELAAAEPLVVNPISMDWDPQGRLWVACTPGYPDKARFSGVPPHDRIVVLTDRDADGRMDEAKTFADGLDLVTSFVLYRDGVIASAAPDILYLEDTDGDGVADARSVVFTGFGFGDTHAVVSNFRQGLDGWIYATQGYSGNASRDIRNSLGQSFGAIGNGLFRFRSDGSAIEMVSSYGSNTWGVDIAWDGEIFFTMANGSHLRHVVLPEHSAAPGTFRGLESWKDVTDHDRVFPLVHHDRPPYVQIDFVGGFTGASGSCLYDGGAWPADWDGNHFVCEPTVNLVHRDLLVPDGVTFRASKAKNEEDEEFLAATDLWFRPVHARVGPDGALWILDFSNQAAIHNDTRGPKHGPTNAAVRPDRDHDHGRIWRIQHRAASPQPVPRLAGASPADLVAALEHRNGWVRATAARLLMETPAPRSSPELFRMATESPSPAARIRALWIHARAGFPSDPEKDPYLIAAIGDPSPIVRRNAVRAVARTLGTVEPSPSLLGVLSKLACDSDPRMRLTAITALRAPDQLPHVSWISLLMAWLMVEDPWTRSSITGLARSKGLARDLDSILKALGGPIPEDFLVEFAAGIAVRSESSELSRLLQVLAEQPVELAPVVAGLIRRFTIELPTAATAPPGIAPQLARLLRHPDPSVAIATLPLAARWDARGDLSNEVTALGDRLLALLRDESTPDAPALEALRALLAIDARRAAALEAAATLLAPRRAAETQSAAVDALGAISDPAAGALLANGYASLGTAARGRAFERLVARPAWTAALLDELREERLSANDLGPAGLDRLRHHPDAATAARAREVLDALDGGAETKNVEEWIAKLLPIAQQPGDAARGREIFRTNCFSCHAVAGEGGKMGPDLTGMGAHGARALLPIVLDPSRTVEASYVEYAAETKDERLFTGILARESADSVVLRSTAGDQEIRRADLLSLRSTGRSPMPTGFETLGGESLRDLFAFLAGDAEGFRVLDLKPLFTASTREGLYDPKRDPNRMELARTGLVRVEGVPFDVVDPARGKNALVLKGGRVAGWRSKEEMPRRVEVPVGLAVARVHALSGIAAWGHPCTTDERPIVLWTWVYADGEREEAVLRDGVEFADWIRRVDVPGSAWVDLVRKGSPGQVRLFSVAPSRAVPVEKIVLASYDDDRAPTFLALTAELPGRAEEPAEVLLVGGGSSHDFAKWWGGSDLALLGDGTTARYTEDPKSLAARIPAARLLVLANNQPIPADARREVHGLVERGGGLLLLHPATWFNWADWPEFNARLVGGGSRSHETYGEFEVRVVDASHPLAEGLPETFRVKDELYRFEREPSGPELHVVAVGRSLATGAEFPVVWTVERASGRTACITLGHDGAAHEHPAYRTLLRNAARWLRAR